MKRQMANRKDIVLRGMACNNQFRFFVADTTGIVQTAMELHKLAPAPGLLLGRTLTAALLMGSTIKDESNSLTVNIEAEGALKGCIAIYEPIGQVRGYAKNVTFFDETISNNWQIGKLLGAGTLSIIKDLKLKAPVTGTIELLTGEVGDDIASYYLNSEQVPSAVSLGVLFNREGKVLAAGGYLIQQLPAADPKNVDKLRSNLAETPYITDLLDMGTDWKELLECMIFKQMDFTIMEEIPAMYHCPCSRERFARALRLLGKAELKSMTGCISPVCHYCNKQYDFSPEDISRIISSLEEKGESDD